MHITLFGQLVILGFAISILFFWIKKVKLRVLAAVFPLLSSIESIYVGWRWTKPELYTSHIAYLWGGMPSFLIAIGFPFIGFCLEALLPQRWKEMLMAAHIFPFSTNSEMSRQELNRCFKWSFWYSFTTLMLHEASQYLNISSRNTFDLFDFAAISAGSILSVILFALLKKNSQSYDFHR